MPLPDIQLDDRRFEDLVAEARRRITAYTPEWTDHNESDPGITLIQLFAWLEEMILWRLNRVPRKNFVKFLELVGIDLNPPAPARVELTFKLSSKDLPDAVVIPQGTEVTVSGGGEGGPIIFETDDNVLAVGAELAAVQTFDGAQYFPVTEANRVPGQSFSPLSKEPQEGAALYLGFDRKFPPGRHRLTVHAAPSNGSVVVQGGGNDGGNISPPVIAYWEYWSGDTTRWQRLSVPTDETRNLTRTGVVCFDAPPAKPTDPDWVATKYGMLQKPDDKALFWLRYRIDQVLGAGYETPPTLEDVLVNTITATNAVTETDEVLGASNGQPNQTFKLAKTPVLPKDPATPGIIAVDEGNGFEVWTEVQDFAGAGRDDKVYTITRATGEVAFGDGEHGKIPRWRSGDSSNSEAADIPNIKATTYRWGGGARGNVGANTVTALQAALPYVESVTNLRPAVGGQDEETVAKAEERGPMTIRTQSRAVTAEDFAFLAKNTPGAQIARAQALPLHHPKLQLARAAGENLPVTEVPIPGVVTVLVVPHSPNPMPLPSEETLTLVAGWLDQHRLVTCELYVGAPRYRKVEIQANVIADPSVSSGLVELSLQQKLLQYFNPLTGGPDGDGWEFGGTIYFSEIYRQILTMPGVLRLESGAVKTFLDDVEQPASTDIALQADELVYSVKHTIMVTYP